MSEIKGISFRLSGSERQYIVIPSLHIYIVYSKETGVRRFYYGIFIGDWNDQKSFSLVPSWLMTLENGQEVKIPDHYVRKVVTLVEAQEMVEPTSEYLEERIFDPQPETHGDRTYG